jgi:hypothetical protein
MSRYDNGTAEGDAAVEASPDKNVLKVLASAITYQVVPGDIKHLRYTLRQRGGKVWSISLEDVDGQLGNFVASLGKDTVAAHGITLEDVLQVLRDKGAKVKKAVRRSRPTFFSIYD